MALSPHPRDFRLVVVEVEVDGLNVEDGEDTVVVEFRGKVLPSTKKRLESAFDDGRYVFEQKVLA